MKKLLIAMTAAAVGFGAWATEEQTPTLLDENFNSDWTNDVELGYMTALPEGKTLWSYSGDIGAEELKVVTQVGSDKALTLNTGSKVLNAKFTEDQDGVEIPDGGLFFRATVKFSDPSDTLPTLTGSDKFAFVVLDNVESLTTEGMHAESDEPATNLWVIAKYGPESDGVSRAYKLIIPDEDDTINAIPAGWFDEEKRIEVKAYNNVMADGQAERAGFVVAIDGMLCEVEYSCPIANNVINLNSKLWAESANYLGVDSANLSTLGKTLFNKKRLLLSRVDNNQNLLSVDFQGQGQIDDVCLATTNVADFDDAGMTLTIEGYNAMGISAINGLTLTEGVYAITEAVGATLTFTVTVANNYVLKTTDATVAKNGNVYTLTYTVTSAASQEIELDVYKPAAYIGETDYKTLALAVSAASADSTIDLFSDVKLDSAVAINNNLTINLNGKKLSAALSGAFTSMFKITAGLTLTITDTANGVLEVTGGNRVLATSNRGAATVAIKNGTIDAACVVGADVNYVITGGKFLKAANATAPTVADGYTTNDASTDTYWVVTEASSDPLPALPGNATDEDVTTALGEQADEDVAVNVTTVEEYNSFKTWADATTGGAAAVVASRNAWVAYALDAASLLTEATKVELTDADITVESFAQDTTDGAADGQFTLEISLKNITIGAGATKANLLKLLDAEGTTDLGTAFASDAVNKDVAVNAGKAKFTVSPKVAEVDTKPSKFFYKAKIK